MSRLARSSILTATLAALPLALALSSSACRGQERAARDTARVRAVVDSLLPRLQVLTGLTAEHPIRIGYRTRAEVHAYVMHQLDKDMSPAEAAGLEGTYAALGLIPDTLHLRRLLLDLYTEQVSGYYDPETKTFYTVEGTPPDLLRTVLAHELVHALQDQHTNLDSIISPKRGNDRESAAQAAVEGQATAVMFAIVTEESIHASVDPTRLPDLGAQLRPAIEAQNSQFPVYRRAPRIIREALVFPYLQGAAFVQALWRNRLRPTAAPARAGAAAAAPVPWPAPLDSLLPQSTEQVMHPERFLRFRDAPTELLLAASPDDSWHTVYENVLGELETTVFLREHLGQTAQARGWDGDRFRLLEGPGGARALVWYSVWDDPASADAFAASYRATLPRRAGRQALVDRLTVANRPVVRVVDTPSAVVPATVPVPQLQALVGGMP